MSEYSAYLVKYRLLSPLHTGWRTMGFVRKTRPYLPAWTMWGAWTARIKQTSLPLPSSNISPVEFFELLTFKAQTTSDFKATATSSYEDIGKCLLNNICMTHFFVCCDEKWHRPVFALGGGQAEGTIAIDKFESKFISSRTTTAISPSSRTAQDESLHEVEHIRPVVKNDSGASPPFLPVLLAAYVFVKKDSPFGEDGFADILQKLGELQLGGERKSGYGRMVLESAEKIADNSLLFGEKSGLWWTGADSITCCPGSILPVHLPLADNALELNGQLEPIVRRLWDKTKGAGQQAQREEKYSLYWTPGSMVKCQGGLELTPDSLTPDSLTPGPLGIFFIKEPGSSP